MGSHFDLRGVKGNKKMRKYIDTLDGRSTNSRLGLLAIMALDRGLGLDKRAKMFVGSVKALQMIVLAGSVIRASLRHSHSGISTDEGRSREGPEWM